MSDIAHMPAWTRIRDRAQEVYARGSYVSALLRKPVTVETAAAAVQSRLPARSAAFLQTVGQAIFANGTSPYLPLLQHAGYDFPRFRALIEARGIEAGLLELQKGGVYFSIEEFQGSQEVRRDGLTFRVSPKAFDNPLVQTGLHARSGGTRSQGILSTIPLSNHRMGTEHLALALDAYGVADGVTAVFLPDVHGASLWAVLALGAIGKPPHQWFAPFQGWYAHSRRFHATFVATLLAARRYGVGLPRPKFVPLGDEASVLPWIAGRPTATCAIFTTPSFALRIALAARQAAIVLSGVIFVTVGEPLTPTKSRGIASAGARAFSSFGFTEFGRATYGCANPSAADDTHVCADAVAVGIRSRAVDRHATMLDVLLFTSLRSDARKILLNVETGDYAEFNDESCGCPLERVGWTRRLRNIRSFEKMNAEGRLFFGSQLITLIEDALPQQFGGDPTAYQLVEEEDEDGLTRLTLRVHPRLGQLDDRQVRAVVEKELEHAATGSAQRLTAEFWKLAGTLRIERAEPIYTKAGKIMPLHHLARDADGQR